MVEVGAQQLPFDMFRPPCPDVSNGQPCRYRADHEPYPHTYGGGLNDPVHNRHCPELKQHPPHAWTDDDKAWFNCSGADCERKPS